MLRIRFLVLSFLLMTAPAFAGNATGSVGIELGLGYFSNYGIFGVGARYFATENLDFHLTSGADYAGKQTGLGLRYYFLNFDTGCFISFNCESNLYAGGTYLLSTGGLVSVTSNGITGDYDYSRGDSISATFGMFQRLGSLTSSVELGYRKWNKKPEATFKSGTLSQDQLDKMNSNIKDTPTLAATIGWLFD